MFSLSLWSWSRCVVDTHCDSTVGFTLTQVFTGEVPFYPHLPAAAMLAILAAKRPGRPAHPNLTEELWGLMKRCWDQDPHLRPETSVVLRTLRGSSVSPLSRRPGVRLPEPCTVTPLPTYPFQVTGLRSLQVPRCYRNPQTKKRTNTLGLSGSVRLVWTRSQAQELRRPPQPAKVRARGKVRARAHNYLVTLKWRHATRRRAKVILTRTTKKGVGRVETPVVINHAGGHPNPNRRRRYPLTPLSLIQSSMVTPAGLPSPIQTFTPARVRTTPRKSMSTIYLSTTVPLVGQLLR